MRFELVGKAEMTEFAASPVGIVRGKGLVRNPLFPDRIPGGSSTGCATAVAANTADLGIGTDTGGSIRIPAACCHLYGLKASRRMVPLDGVQPLARTLDSLGLIARDLASIQEGLHVLGVPEPTRYSGSPLRMVGLSGISAPPMRDFVDRVCRNIGVDLIGVSFHEWMKYVGAWDRRIALEMLPSLVYAQMKHGLRGSSELMERALTSFLDAVVAAPARTASEDVDESVALVDDLLDEHDVLIMPSLYDMVPTAEGAVSAGRWLRYMTAPLNLIDCCALSMPVGVTREGTPLSIQIVGRPGSEFLLLDAAGLISERLKVMNCL